ncbi:MAG: C13 family peptidase, partial [Chloroflexota bacterium]
EEFLNEKSPGWDTTQTVAPSDLVAIHQPENSIEVTWVPILFQDKVGHYEILVTTVDNEPIYTATTESKSENAHVIMGLDLKPNDKVNVRTYTSGHDGNDPNDSSDEQTNEIWSDYRQTQVKDLLTGTAPTTPAQTGIPTYTLTPTETPTIAPTPINTPTPIVSPDRDIYEPNNTCDFARRIDIDGLPQHHTFHQNSDTDWIYFEAPYTGTYQVLVDPPYGSLSDVDLAYYTDCSNQTEGIWSESFTPGVRIDIKSEGNETFYIKLTNRNSDVSGVQASYNITVQLLSDEPPQGAVIIVAGQLREEDQLQTNINNVAEAMYDLFLGKGFTDNNIYVLATDSTLKGYDGEAAVTNVREAITEWAVDHVSDEHGLTLYLIDHGADERLYLAGEDEFLTPADLNNWLTTLETAVPEVETTIIIESCHSGSFIQPKNRDYSISAPNRLVMTSSDPNSDAYASRHGAHFTDNLIIKLGMGYNLVESFNSVVTIINELYSSQNPWIDANGDEVPDSQGDEQVMVPGFTYNNGLGDSWPPFIMYGPMTTTHVVMDHWFEQLVLEVEDNESVEQVWAVMSHQENSLPSTDGELNVELEQNMIDFQHIDGNEREGVYAAILPSGRYRIAIHAQDDDGLAARPVILTVDVPYRFFLPTIRR